VAPALERAVRLAHVVIPDPVTGFCTVIANLFVNLPGAPAQSEQSDVQNVSSDVVLIFVERNCTVVKAETFGVLHVIDDRFLQFVKVIVPMLKALERFTPVNAHEPERYTVGIEAADIASDDRPI
jgi:hypothetical protein